MNDDTERPSTAGAASSDRAAGPAPGAPFIDPVRVRVSSSSFVLRSRIIGQADVLDRLMAGFLETRRDGRLSFTVVVGEPGMGKSRVIEEHVRRIRQKHPGARVAIGHGDGRGVAYGAFARLLAERFGVVSGQSAEETEERILAGVSEVLSADRVTEVAHFLAHLMRAPLADDEVLGPLASAPEQLETRMFIAVRRFLAADAGRAPLVLVIEDLEQCGAESINLLMYLAAGLRASPITLIATAREQAFERHPGFAADADDIDVERIEIAPLTEAEAGELVTALCRPLGTVPERLIAHARKLGDSPRAVSELVRLLLETGVIAAGQRGPGPDDDVDDDDDDDDDDGNSAWVIDEARFSVLELPETQDQLIDQRLQAMPARERDLLGKAAVIGEVFWLDAVVALVRAGRIDREQPDGPLLADIARAGDQSRDAIAGLVDNLVDRDWVTEVISPSVAGEREYRFTYPTLWSSVLERVPADERTRYHRTVAQWLELRPDVRGPAAQEEIARHLEAAGLKAAAAACYRRAGDAARDEYFNDRAVDLYHSALDNLGHGDVVARMHLWHDLGSIQELMGEFEDALDALERMLRLAWVVAARGEAAVAFNMMGRVWRRKGDLRLALEYLERGAELFDHLGDERGIAGSLDDIGKVLYLLGRYDEAYHKVSEGLERLGRDGDDRAIAASLSSLGSIESARGRFADARRYHTEALDLRRAAGDRWGVVSSLNNIAALDYEHGDLRLARSGWLQSLAEAEAIGALPLAAMAQSNLGELALDEGQLDEARRRLADGLEIARDIDDRRIQAETLRNSAHLENRRGFAEKAERLAHESHLIARDAGLRDAEGKALLCLAEIAAARDKNEAKNEARNDAGGAGNLPRPTAEQYFERGVALLRELGNSAELARGLQHFGRYRRRRGERDAGDALLREARTLFHKLGLEQVDEPQG